MSDVLANFSCLDELIQVIYQSIYKFVVLSSVSGDKWNIHVGLAGSEGRWWHGCWTEEDIHRIFGSKSSDKLLESFAEKLAEVFVQGETCISEWSAEKGAKIKFTLGPASKKPMHVSLFEMTSAEAAAHATRVFTEIALQAQSRKCRLYPPSNDYPTFSTSFSNATRSTLHTEVPSKRKESSPEPRIHHKHNEASSSKSNTKSDEQAPSMAAAQEEIKALKSQLKNAKRTGSPVQKPAAPVARAKGASLANPNKKARKYQAIEFGSDDE